jgi:hypothetical protein
MNKETVTITEERYHQLCMLEIRNTILTRRIDELLIEISELQELLNQKVILPTKKNKLKIKQVYFNE